MGMSKTKIILLAVLGTVVLAGLVAGILVWQLVDWGDEDDASVNDYSSPPSHSELGVYESAAVATDAPYCSDIGKKLLEKNGSVADAAIGTALCIGLIQSQSMGLGGGFIMVMYNATTKKAETLNARERAPAAATWDMFAGNASASARGKLSVAVPGELKGYWELWKKSGRLPWSELFQPTIALAISGYNVTRHAANALYSNREAIKASETLAEIFVNPETGEVFKQGDLLTRPDLAGTLETISLADTKIGGDILYQRNHEMMKGFVQDLKDVGGILTEDDMVNYQVTWDPPMEMDINGGFKVHSVPPPASGLLLAFIMKVMSFYEGLRVNALVTYQRLVESFKHAYAKRTILGDQHTKNATVFKEIEELKNNLTSLDYINQVFGKIHDNSTSNNESYYGAEFYQPDDHGTAHLCVIAPNGDAIALTSTINLYYGSRIRSRSTGIIYNDQMDDFSNPNITNQFGVPPSQNNFIEPGNRPVSSMTPAIFTDSNGKVRLVVGGAGGTKITTAVAFVAVRNLWLGDNIKEAIDARRIHHQLAPMQAEYEEDFDPRIVEGLERIGHKTDEFPVGTSVIQGIAVSADGIIYANSDFRKEGTVAGI